MFMTANYATTQRKNIVFILAFDNPKKRMSFK